MGIVGLTVSFYIYDCFLLTKTFFLSDKYYILILFQVYEIDETSQEYLALHPMAVSKKQKSLLKEHFEPVMSDEDQSQSDSDVSASSEDEPANILKAKSRVPR